MRAPRVHHASRRRGGAWPTAARAQKALPRIGWLVYGDAQLGPIDRSLKEALAQAGLVDGRNIEIIFRYANGISDRLAQLAAELVAQNPDLLLAIGGDVIKPLFEASKGSIPIVGGVSDSPMRAGIAMSLARPGKNFTGITYLTDEMAAKRIELLKEVAPNARRVAVIFNPQHFDDEVTFARRGAESLGIELTTHPINKVADLDAALNEVSASGTNSLLVISSRLTGLVGDENRSVWARAPASRDCFVAGIRIQRRLVVLRTESNFRGQTFSGLCAKGFERGKAGRFAYRATREVRTCYQSQDGANPRNVDQPSDFLAARRDELIE